MGTIGGSIANNDPAADYPSAVLALGGTVVTNKREIAADDFFEGMFATALEDGEIITAVKFAPPKRGGYAKFPQPGLALCDGRGLRGRHGVGRPRRGDRRGRERRVPARGPGSGAQGELRAGSR